MSLKRYLDERQSKPKIFENKPHDISEDEITQYTDLEFGFELSGKQKKLSFCHFKSVILIEMLLLYLQRYQLKYTKIVNRCYPQNRRSPVMKRQRKSLPRQPVQFHRQPVPYRSSKHAVYRSNYHLR